MTPYEFAEKNFELFQRWDEEAALDFARRYSESEIKELRTECNRLGQGQILLADEVAELEAENQRLKAQASDEWSIWFPGKNDFFAQIMASRATAKDQKNSETTCDLCVHEGEMCPSLGLQMMNERCDKYTRTTAKEGGNRGRE